jgi:hypothetical protein
MKHIHITHDEGVTVNWSLDPRLQAGAVTLYVAADIAPTDEVCSQRGKPRLDYQRTYNVIPQDATEERAVEIFRQAWRAGKQTCGGSNDDAGIGDLLVRNVVLWDIPEIQRHTFKTWYIANYPGCWVDFK